MTRLKTTDEDELVHGPDGDEQELSVNYYLGDDEPIHGMLPLAGIQTSAALLNELAEFGCELQDDFILSVSMVEVEYVDLRGKAKTLGPRTPLGEVIEAGEVTVVFKAAAQQQPAGRKKIINGARTISALDDDDDDFDCESAPKRAVAVKMAPRPIGVR